MAKQNSQGSKPLSPANYIRQKSRQLPIYQCFINDGWQEKGMANILISRRHRQGNVTCCSYLVDISLLGIKDTLFRFNLVEDDYEEFKELYFSRAESFLEIDYQLAHNIIFAAWEFAEQFEFKPCKEFLSTTQYFLEEDDDRIDLIEIECGKDGKPFYVRGPYDNDQKAQKILAQLERTAGAGNYHYLLEVGREFTNDGDDSDDWDYDDEDLEEYDWNEDENLDEVK
jgi:hypothetical protein